MRLNRHGCSVLALLLTTAALAAEPIVSDDPLAPSVMEPAAPSDVPLPEPYDHAASNPLDPEPAPTAEPVEPPKAAEVVQEPEQPKQPEPEIVSEPEVVKPQTAASERKLERQRILETPTRSLEAYEKARKEYLQDQSVPYWSFNLGVAPRAFGNADLRVPITANPNEGKPHLTGILIGGERMLLRHAGLLALGGELGFYGNTQRNGFTNLTPAIMSLGPYLLYQVNFLPRQIIVPTFKAGYDITRINYTYFGNRVSDVRAMPRIDLGVLIYLNFLEPGSAGQMQSNWGVRRTYLSAYYSIATDTDKGLVDLSDSGAFRFGFRFEM